MHLRWLLSQGRQASAAAGPAEAAPASAVADEAGGTIVSPDQVTLEAIRDPASADQLIRVEDARADRRRREEQDSTTQYIRRLHAVVLYSVIAIIVVTGCVMLVLYSVGGLQIPGSRILQTAVSVVATALVTGLVFAVVRRVQSMFTGSPPADRGASSPGDRSGDERSRADAP